MIEIIKNNPEIFEVCNDLIGFKFNKNDENHGTYEIFSIKEGLKHNKIKECYSTINFHSLDKDNLIEYTSKNFFFESKTETFVNSFGTGLKIIFKPIPENNHETMFNIQFLLYDDKDFLLVKLINIKNDNINQLPVHSISPLTIKNSSLWLTGLENPTDLYNISWFKNGWQSWSNCELFFGNQRDSEGATTEVLNQIYDNQDYMIKGRFYSEYCTAITDLNSEHSLIIGFVSLNDQFSRIVIDFNDSKTLKLLSAFGCMDKVKFSKSSIKSSEELLISFKCQKNGYIGLIDYAKIVNLNIKEPRITQIPIGWCSWYYYFTNVTQEDIIKNLTFFDKRRDIPIDFFQLDDGYFTKIGDFSEINEKFPDGLPWLFKKIKKLGFKGGIWTAPFIAIKRSNFFKNHRKWFLTKTNKLLPVLFNWRSFEYSLDLSNSEVLNHLFLYFTNLIQALRQETNHRKDKLITFLKIDFLHAGTPYGADYSNPDYTRAQILYNAIKTIREAIMNDTFLLGCGAPLGPCVGLVDAMRISCDTDPIWDAGYIEKFGNGRGLSEISLKAALLNTLYRSFMHNYFWINDPDCLMIRRTDTELNTDEIRLQMTIFGLSGGQLLISDDMTKLTEEEIKDAKLLLPPYNPKAFDPILVDAFTSRLPSIYMLETDELIGKRFLLALINWNNNPISKKLKIFDLIPNLSKNDEKFYVFDFWEEKFLGEFRINDYIELREIKPHSSRYLTLIPLTKKLEHLPILITSNLHISQGCCEIKKFDYIPKINQLKIKLELTGTREGFLLLKLPRDRNIIKSNSKYSKVDSKNNLWKVFVQFKNKFLLNIDLE
ncbi:MAG: glycoside hydrolase family 36 protein [Promethearchaeota archaeon]